MGGYLVDTNVVLDVVRLVLVAKPLYEAVMKDLKDVEALRQVASAVDGINRRWVASFLFLSYKCTRGGGCFVVDFARRIELPRVFTKLLLGGALSVGRGGGSLLDEVVGLAERWLSMVGSSLGVGVLGMDYGDFEVAREVVKVYGACGSRSLARVLDNAIDILLVAVALNRGYGFVTTDKRLVCGLGNRIVTGVGQVRGGDVPWGSLVCPADARLGVGGEVLSAKIYLIHEQCNLQCSERERWC
jgi:predicted nucleic acid-binding protein